MTRRNDDAFALAFLVGMLLVMINLMSPSRVSIKVRPAAVMTGGSLVVTCSVPRHSENRKLTVGLNDYVESQMPLEGEGARVTHEIPYDHVPCLVKVAYCVVEDQSGQQFLARTSVLVAGCEEP
jgi:hypothetical protein